MSASRDGNGTFNRAYDWTDDAANSIPITASRFDTEMDGIASELSNSVAADGQTTMSGNLKMGGFKVTGMANGSSSADGVTFSQMNTAIDAAYAKAAKVGEIIDFAGAGLQTDFIATDGAAVSRTTYAALFTAIGTTWGVGDGSTTFNVPNLARRVTVGSGGSGTGTLGNALGNTGGAETFSIAKTNLPNVQLGSGIGDTSSVTSIGAFFRGNQACTVTDSVTTDVGDASIEALTEALGSGTAMTLMQPSAVVYKQIRYQ